jgi:hypothetical protein
MTQTAREKQVHTIERDRREFLREQIESLAMQLAGPRCNVRDERRDELEARYLILLAEYHDLRPPPANPLGDPDDD